MGWKVTGKNVGNNKVPAAADANGNDYQVGEVYNYTYSSDALDAALQKYKNDPDALARINSIVRSFSRKYTLGDALSSLIGRRTGADRDMQSYALDADKALADVLTDIANRDYNSEGAKASRMEAAGMNADLLGIDGASEVSGSAPDEVMPEIAPDSSPFNDVQGIANNLFQIFPTLMSFAQGFQSLKLGEEDIYQRRISSLFGTSDDMIKDALRSIPDFDKGMYGNYEFDRDQKDANGGLFMLGNIELGPDSTYDDYQRKYRTKGFASWAQSYLMDKVNSLPQRYRKRAFHDLNRVISSSQFDGLRAAVQSGKVNDFYSAAEGMTSGVWDSDFGNFLSNFNSKYGSYQKDIFDWNKQLERDGLSIEMLENAYNTAYWTNLEGLTAAEAQNKQNAAIKAIDDYEKSENTFWNGLLKDMPNNWFGQLLTLGVLFLRANSKQGFSFPSINSGSSYRRGRRSSQWDKSGGYSEGTDDGGGSWFSIGH